MNLQIVVCPGLNDGAELSRTTSDLAAMVPQVNSVSVVPVGLTKYREGLYPLRAVTGEDARSMISITNAMGDHCKKETGRRVFYVSDELYLKAGLPLPDYDYYDEFCQRENGVGMLRLLEHEFWGALENLEKIAGPTKKIIPFTCVTGAAAKPFLTSLIDGLARKCDNVRDSFNIYCIENRFFGNGVNVAGLITGGDIAGQLAGKPLLGRVLISASMLRHGEDVFLDNMTRAELSKILNRPVIPVENDGKKLLYAMLGIETDGEKHE